MKTPHSLIPKEIIEQRIYFLRDEKVMLSTDLARLYQVAARVLVQAVKRNADRFPSDFMFQLTAEEFQNLKSQIVTSSWGGLRRAIRYGFTEQGVAMLSSVLRSRRAVRVNIEIMRAFVRLRQMMGYDFHRQKPLDEYIVDFYCPALGLAVEIDGDSHALKADEDKERQKRLEDLGIRFLRFGDLEVKFEMERVLKTIETWIKELEKN